MKLNKHIQLLVPACLVVVLISCGKTDPNSPGLEYMPDMYRSPSYETNMATVENGDTVPANRLPAPHTIARGKMPYMFANNTAGYDSAGKFLRNPVSFSEEIVAEGEIIYTKYCTHCHGQKGKGDGLVAGKLPGAPPAFDVALKDLPEGKIFHSITYGKGLMGAHGNMLTPDERWKLVHFIQKLQGKGLPSTAQAADTGTKPAEETTVKTASAQDSIPSK